MNKKGVLMCEKTTKIDVPGDVKDAVESILYALKLRGDILHYAVQYDSEGKLSVNYVPRVEVKSIGVSVNLSNPAKNTPQYRFIELTRTWRESAESKLVGKVMVGNLTASRMTLWTMSY